MKLRIRLGSADVEIEAGADARVADLTGGAGLVVDGRFVRPEVLLAEAGLYEGAVVDVTDRPPVGRRTVVANHGLVVAVVGGVAAGRTFPLTDDVVLGRDPACAIVIDDPALSPRHARVTSDGRVVDLGSTNGTRVDHGLIRMGATQLRVRAVDNDRPSAARTGVTIPFNRPPRPPLPVAPAAPPTATASRSFGVAMVLGPLLMAAAMVAIYGDPRFFALFALLAPMTAAINWMATKGSSWRDRRRYERERTSYAREIDRHLCDPAEVVRRAALPSVRLWERRPDHDDFLRLRLGAGTEVVAVSLAHGRVVGIAGDRSAALALARSLALQAAVHHGPADLGIRVLGGDEWEWTKWLPHTRTEVPDRATLVVVDDAGTSTRALLTGNAGIVIAPTADQLPSICSATVVVHSQLGNTDDFLVAGVDTEVATTCARALARYDDPELEGGGLPGVVRLSDLLQTGQSTTVATPIGVGHDGVVEIDLDRDGPHVLIGGTTGSGKSELLRTLVVGLAARVDPTRLTFVLIDYKGGSAFDECTRLPHVVGVVTDLDEHLAERALRSLRAELRRREQIARDGGDVPKLAVVVDEFATLAAELPDFLDALVDIAQRGRSLGVHLVLATQRPSGAVSANIKANTNLRIALRVQDSGDSTDIIDDPAAARISRSTPGRAYIRRGAGDVIVVQTALASAPHEERNGARVRLRPFRRHDVAVGPTETVGQSDLQVLVDAITAGWTGPPSRRPWLPVLPDSIERRELPADAFALADEPDHQRQTPVGWNPDHGHLALYGIPGSGTTTAVLSVVDSVVRTRTPDECHLYAIDYGTNGLARLRDLPHVGAVIAAAERERQSRLLNRLHTELQRRRTTGEHVPRIVVCIDGIGAFLADRDDIDSLDELEAFRRVFAEGPTAGISFIVTATSAAALPLRLAALVEQKLVFRLADPSDHGLLGRRSVQLPRFTPGRALHQVGVVQVALPGSFDDVTGERVAPPIGTLPREVDVQQLPPPSRCSIPIGIAEDDLDVARLHLHPGEHVLLCGPPRSGKTHALELLEKQLRATGLDVVAIDDTPRVDDPDGEVAALLRRGDVHVIAAGRTDEVRAAYGHWLRILRQSRTGVLLQPDLASDGDLLGVRLPRRVHVAMPPGRGFLVENGVSRLVQLAR